LVFSVQELKEDFDELRDILENEHPTLYMFDKKAEKDRYFDSIYSEIKKPQTEIEFLRFLAPIIAEIKCGHNIIEGSEKLRRHFNTKAKIIPFLLYFEGGKSYIYKDYSGNTQLTPGAEILSINDRNTKEILNILLKSLSSDGYNKTYKLWKIYKDFPYHYYSFVDSSSTFNIDYRRPGDSTVYNIRLTGLLSRKIFTRFKTFQYPQLKRIKSDRNIIIIDSLNTAVFRFSSFINETGISHEEYISRIFTQLKEGNIKNLIIDLRGNDGGPPEPSIKMLAHLLDEPFTYFSRPVYMLFKYNKLFYPEPNLFNGNLFVLVNGGCFSTTGHFCSHLKNTNRAVFIGEETGGNFYCSDNSEETELSNTGIYVRYARTTFATDVDFDQPGRGIFPDYEVTPTLSDILTEKDVVMEKAIELIKGNYIFK
jgi:hypothetical protein